MVSIKRAADGYDYISYESQYYNRSDWDIIPEDLGQPAAQPVRTSRTLKAVRPIENAAPVHRADPESVLKRRKTVLYAVMILIVFMLMVMVVYRYAVLSDMHIDNLRLRADITELDNQLEKLEETISSSRDLEAVMSRADELGMSFASGSQIRYIELGGEAGQDVAGG